MELKDLVGEHLLTGVDMNSEKVEQWDGLFEDCQVVNFILDGKTYTAIEDPDDGYRSFMKELMESADPVQNTFPAQRVVGRMREDGTYMQHDVLELVDVKTGDVVLAVGTDNHDDYYPMWVCEWYPENMSINAGLA